MSKYNGLWEFLAKNEKDQYKLTFEEIHQILGFEIDHSFLNYKKEAPQYGYQVGKISLKEKHVTFIRAEIPVNE
jgi:hypothetical protein